MVTDVGGDHIGDIICNYLKVNGVSSEYVCRHENVKSHITLAFLDENNDVRPVVGGLLRDSRKAGAWLYYDVNFRKNHIAELPVVLTNIEENMSLANVVRGSMEDFGYMYDLHDGEAIYKKVSRFCKALILTDGANTIRVYTPDSCETYPVHGSTLESGCVPSDRE